MKKFIIIVLFILIAMVYCQESLYLGKWVVVGDSNVSLGVVYLYKDIEIVKGKAGYLLLTKNEESNDFDVINLAMENNCLFIFLSMIGKYPLVISSDNYLCILNYKYKKL